MNFQERVREAYGPKWEPFIGHASRYILYCKSTDAIETWRMLEEPLWNKLFDQHNPLPARTLDYGAGLGKVVDVILKRIHGPDNIPESIHAYEPNSILRRELDRLYGWMSFVTSMKTLDVAASDGMYDLVTSNMVFNHLSNEEHTEALGDIQRVLTPGGTLAYVIPYPQRQGRDGQEFIDETPWGGFVAYYHRSVTFEERRLYQSGFVEITTTIMDYDGIRNPHLPPRNPNRKRVLITAKKQR